MSFTMVDGKGKTLHERLAQAAAWPLICSDSQQTQKSQRKIILLCGSFFQLNQYSVKLNEIRRGAYDPADRLTTGAWLDEWFNTFYRPTVKPSTAATTYGNIRRLKESFGSCRRIP